MNRDPVRARFDTAFASLSAPARRMTPTGDGTILDLRASDAAAEAPLITRVN